MTTPRSPELSLTRRSGAGKRSRNVSARESGIGIALALGGGFSRGFAHLGVLDVLEQEQIPISLIVGTSIGGLLGAAYADGISVDELCDLGSRVRVRDLIRFQKPTDSNSGPNGQSHDLIGRFIREWFHAHRVEELLIPTAIVATNLDTGAAHVFTRGPLEVAIRASCAFPGLFQPVEHDGMMLGDGCIVAPVPTLVAARMNAGCVLGVAVGSNSSNAGSCEKVVKLYDRTTRRPQTHVMETSWTRHADIILEPEVHQIEWNDFSRADEARAAGADAMRCALPDVRELLARQIQPSIPEETAGAAQSELAL